jgi:transglutaminase-like putative cysteine protease
MTRTNTYQPIITALVVAIFPHITRLPVWIILWCACMWGYLLFAVKYRWPRPGKNLRRFLTVAGFAGLMLTYQRHLGQDAYIGLLAVMAALKPFEIETHRDRMITVFLAYFIVITSLFLSETLAITLYMFFSVTITTAVLIRINDPAGRFKQHLKLSGLMMVQAIPLMVALFFLFPRIQGSLFGFSLSNSARSGFSDILAPGGVASLVESDEVAFRAVFDGPIPPASALYWRGIVFQNFDGRRWRPDKEVAVSTPPMAEPGTIGYTVALEPHDQRWLFALEMPATVPPQASFYGDFTLRSRRTVRRQLRYDMVSDTRFQANTEAAETLENCRRLPEGYNPRARELAARLTQTAGTAKEKVRRILDFFASGGFTYTLQPPRLGRDSVDDFLFDSKRGYCEHYASAFAFMMRSVNVPARIVGGYLGGERNPFANYLVVRQSDAHVWVDVWQGDDAADAGWRRIDPTAVVVPERITQGLSGALARGELPDFLSRGYFGFIWQIRFAWDAVSTQWSAWFEGYSYYEQLALLKKLGLSSDAVRAALQAMILILVVIAAAVAVYFWSAMRIPQRKPDRIRKTYEKFSKKLARAGFERKPDQGPVDYAAWVATHRPDLKRRVDDITELYVRLRYQEQQSNQVLAEFMKKVRVFDPVLK